MKKRIRAIGVTLGFLLLLAGGGVWYLNWMMRQPMYSFGDVREGKNLRASLVPPEQSDSETWLVEPDIRLGFDAHGEGHPVLIVHGGPGMPYPSNWKGLASLTDRFRFYFYHQRGCGRSTRPFDRFSGGYYQNMVELEQTLGLGAQIADIERIRQILGREKITLIGHSFGGFIAALYAAEFPDRVDKLVLVAPAGMLTPPDKERDLFQLTRAKLAERQQEAFDIFRNEYLDFGNIFEKSDKDLADRHQRLGEFVLSALDRPASDLRDHPPVGGWSVFALYFSVGRAQDYRPALQAITAPTLIIQGEDDELALAGTNTYKPIPGSRFAILKRETETQQAGHFVFDESPHTFADRVEQFLSE
ncbi:MAG: alpha/beta hydrolase [Planctomycetota bacterium]